MLTRCLALAIAIVSTTTAYSGTLQEGYEKLWSKRAIDLNSSDALAQKPKAACVCMDGGANQGRLGALIKMNTLGLCGHPVFDGAGNVTFFNACYTYGYIGK